VSRDSLDNGYEPMRMRARGLVWFVVVLVVSGAVTSLALWVLLKRFDREFRQAERPASVVVDAGGVPRGEQGPPLQPSTGHDALPREDLAAMRQQEDEVFARLGWVDGTTHEVRVPEAVVTAVAKRSGGAAKAATAPATRSVREGP
jgi:hypothetical protein